MPKTARPMKDLVYPPKRRKIRHTTRPLPDPLAVVPTDIWRLLLGLMTFEEKLMFQATAKYFRELFWKKLQCLGLKKGTPLGNVFSKDLTLNIISLRCNLKAKDLKFISARFPSLTRLNLTSSEIAVADLKYLWQLKKLKELNINKTTLELNALTGISTLKNLQVLHAEHLPAEHFGRRRRKEPIMHISFARSLERLNLSSSDVDDQLLNSVHLLPRLSRLDLSFTRITSDSIRSISRLPMLSDLNMFDCPISDEGFGFLRHATKLYRLILGTNQKESQHTITDLGLSFIKSLKSLEVLGLRNCLITDEGVGVAVNSFQKLHVLDVQGCPITDRSLRKLCECSCLSHLEVGNDKLTDVGYRYLCNISTLSYLGSCHGMEIPSLARFTSLRALSLDTTWTVVTALQYIAQLTQIVALSFRDCDWVTTDSLVALRSLTQLRYLYVGDRWKPESSQFLLSMLKNVEIKQHRHQFTRTTGQNSDYEIVEIK